jgi:uncharacterized protein YkwD
MRPPDPEGVRAPSTLVRWLQVLTVVGVALTLAVGVVPSAGAAAHPARHAKRHHKHHRHHKRSHIRRHHIRRQVHAARARHRVRQQPATVSLAQPAQQCPGADTPATSASVDAIRAAVVCLINQQRNAHGLPSLNVSTRLNNSAQSWNERMVATGDFTHGDNFAGRISAVGYDWQTAGENIATGYPTPRAVVAAWMASPDHCRNILDPNFRDVGTGVTAAAVGSWASQPSTFTQDFGLLMSQNAPSGNHGPQNGCPY